MSASVPRIYVVTHQAATFPADAGYVPLHAGRALAAEGLGIQGDDTGEQISALNASFCELTALYWIWRNDSHPLVGLNHYRRYFVARRQELGFRDRAIAASGDFHELAEGADLIVAEPDKFERGETGETISTLEHYSRYHVVADMFLTRQVIAAQAPDYLAAFDFQMASNRMASANIFVGRRAAVDAYCRWLFAILFRLEKSIPYKFYDPYQQRVFGFLAERLFNVWLLHNRGTYRIAYRHGIVYA